MDKIGFTFSMLLSLLGVLLLSLGLLVQAGLPKVGLMAFTIGGGTYSPAQYSLGVSYYVYQAVALSCVVLGAILSRRFYRAHSGS